MIRRLLSWPPRRALSSSSRPPAARRFKLLVARHGERLDAVDEEWSFGAEYPLDPPLSSQGCREAERMALALRAEGGAVEAGDPVHVFSSPLRRCLHTAQIVALTLGPRAVFRVEAGLQESPRRLWPHLQAAEGASVVGDAEEGGGSGAAGAGGGGHRVRGTSERRLGTSEDLKAIELVHNMPSVVAEFSRLDPSYPSQFDMITSEATAAETHDRAEAVARKLLATFPGGHVLLVTHHSVARGAVLRMARLDGEGRAAVEREGVPSGAVSVLAPPAGGADDAFDPLTDLYELERLWR